MVFAVYLTKLNSHYRLYLQNYSLLFYKNIMNVTFIFVYVTFTVSSKQQNQKIFETYGDKIICYIEEKGFEK